MQREIITTKTDAILKHDTEVCRGSNLYKFNLIGTMFVMLWSGRGPVERIRIR